MGGHKGTLLVLPLLSFVTEPRALTFMAMPLVSFTPLQKRARFSGEGCKRGTTFVKLPSANIIEWRWIFLF